VRTTVFGGLRIDHDESMLAPREWTLAQAQWAADLLAAAPGGPVLELCAGAGHIGLATIRAVRRPLVAVELNPRACRLLRMNADRAGLGSLVEVREGRVEDALEPDEQFAVVIADPPWVCSAEVSDFPDDPVGTIDGGADGLVVARQCIAVTAAHLRPGGSAVVQVGSPDQAEALREELPGHLEVVEVRQAVRGVLVRLDAA
jgi:release factor glutamine methyltransferase